MEDINFAIHKRMNYADPAPYPEIKVMAPNKYYADVLMEDYAGMASEFTAINQYLYHHFIISQTNKDIGKLLENIAITEMLHLEILANLIILLHGNPIYGGRYNTADRFWNSTYVYYGNNITHQLENDLESEYKAIQNYKRHIGIIKDPYVQAVLKRIIKDEELHVVLFKDAINNLNNKI